MHAVTQRIDVHMEKVNCHPIKSEDITDVWTIKVAKWTEKIRVAAIGDNCIDYYDSLNESIQGETQ